MRLSWITLIIVFAALVVAGFLIFSGNNWYSPNQTQDQGVQPGGVNGAPDNSTQTEPSSNENPQTYAVSINSFSFSPYTLTIKAGDTVTWTNRDSASHTVTSDSGNELDSSSMDKGGTYSHTFTQAGTFDYHCKFHSGMAGKVIVE